MGNELQRTLMRRFILAAAVGGALPMIIPATAGAQVLNSKRGYGDTNATYNGLQSTGAGWYYDWGSTPASTGNFDANFYPMFWNGPSQTAINNALALNPKYILGFNEPERSDQANMTVATAISYWTTISNSTAAYNAAHSTSIKLVSPAVSDTGGTTGGQQWLSSFMSQASSAGLKVDAIAFHWYDDDTTNGTQAASDFESRVSSYHSTYNLPVFITEFADHDWGGTLGTANMIAANTTMLSIVVPWMNSQSWVAGYSWYNWFNDSSLYSGSTPTTLGYPYDGAVAGTTTSDISGTNLGEHVAFLTGGTLTMTSSVGTVKYINALTGTSTITGSINWGLNSAATNNWVQVQSGATLLKSGTNTINLSGGSITNNGVIQVAAGVLQLASSSSGTGSYYLSSTGDGTGSTARIELMGGITVPNAITFAQRNDPAGSDGIRNVNGNNTLSGPVTVTSGGNQARIESDAGLLTLSGRISTDATSARNLYLQGAGNGVVSGVIADNANNASGTINLAKVGTGIWSLTAANTYTGTTTISAGTLQLLGTTAPVASYSFSPGTVSGTTVTNTGAGGSALNGIFNASGGTGSISTTGGPLAGTGALVLNGTGSFLGVNSGVTSLANTSNWTISAWVKTSQAGFTILDKGTAGTNWAASNSTFYLGVAGQSGAAGGGAPVAVRYGGGWLSGTTTPAVNNSSWTLVTYTDNGGTETVYVNGTAESTTQGFGNGDVGNQIRIGLGGTGESDGQAVSNGSISDINIYSSALSAAQIANLYTTNTTPVSTTNILPIGTPVALTAPSSVLDLEAVNQTVASLTGPAGSSVILGNGSKLTVSSSSSGSFAGNLSGNGSLGKSGSGTLTLSAASSYTGATTIGGGTLRLSGALNILPTSTRVSLTLSSAVLDVETTTQTIGSLSGAGGSSVILGSGNSLNVSSASNTSFLGNISGAGSLIKSGSGTLALGGISTFGGSTTINGGTLRLSSPANVTAATPIASYSFNSVSGNTVINSGSGGSSPNGTLNMNSGTGSIASTGGPAAGMGALLLNGDGSTVDINSGITDLSGNSNWTVSAWIKTTQAGATILAKGDGTNWTSGFSNFYLGTATAGGSGGIPNAVRWAGGWAAGSTSVIDGSWHLVTYTDAGGVKTIYVDGSADALSQNQFINTDTGTKVRIGFAPTTIDGELPTSGSLSGINIYNTALSSAQVASLYSVVEGSGTALPSTTNVTVAASSTLDVNGTTQTIASLNGAVGSSVTLGSGTLILNTSGNATFSGIISGTGSITMSGPGTQTLGGDDTYTGNTTVTNGTLNLGANQNTNGILVRNSSGIALTSGKLIVGSATSRANRDLLMIGGTGLNISGNTSTLDLGTNDLDIQNAGTMGLATITNQIRAGYANGTWNGTGIQSTAAASNTTHLTAIGVILNNNIYGTTPGSLGSFDIINPGTNDVLVKYTYYGDTDLNGKVDGSDYARIDNGNLNHLTGWFNGDFNYDSVVNGSDYTLIDNAFNTQGAVLTSEIADPTAIATAQVAPASVPEPVSGALLLIPAVALLSRRRKSRSR